MVKISNENCNKMSREEEFQISQVAFLYYKKNMTQQEIANKFNLSKMMISRMLQKAKKLKIVQVIIPLPFELNGELRKEIKQEYNLKEVIVVKQPTYKINDISKLLAKVWAFYMGILPLDNCVLGMGVGRTIGQVVRSLVPMRTKNLHVVQLMGGLSNVNEQNPFTIIQETCRKLGAQGTYLSSLALVENEEMRDLIYNSSMGYQIMEMWRRCQKAIFGVGAIYKGTFLSPKLVTPHELQKIKRLGAVGDILGHCFDENGNFINSDLETRLVSIPISMLRNIPERIAIAGGEDKAITMRGALRSGLITTFVTDELTAKKLFTKF